MKAKRKTLFLTVCGLLAVALAIGGMVSANGHEKEAVSDVMVDAVLHEGDRITLGPLSVNPSVCSALIVTGVLLLIALLCRLFVIPRFKTVPGKLQSLLEAAVSLFDGLASKNSPHKPGFIGAYCFTSGAYIFVGTCFELLGIQVVNAAGHSISLPAVCADINAAIALGFCSYFIILGGGFAVNGIRGGLSALKDFSLPISMSFRLFGALLSGLLVTELVYYYLALSFVLPVAVGVLFTLLHALIQAYVLTMLTSMFYGEATAPKKPKEKKVKVKS